MFDQSQGVAPEDHGAFLSALAAARPEAIKAEAEAVLTALGEVEVLASRTGLVMQPMRDTVTGTDFHLGEVLMAEAHVRIGSGAEGYGMVVGRDLEHAMAMALLDAARAADVAAARVAAFARDAAAAARERDAALLRRIEATRVEMETF